MAYRNHEHYNDPTAAAIFDKKNVDKWRVVKIEEDPADLFRASRRRKRACELTAAQKKQQELSRQKKLKRYNADLKNRVLKLKRLIIYIDELANHVLNTYTGEKTEEQIYELRKAKMEAVAALNQLRGVILNIGWSNGMERD